MFDRSHDILAMSFLGAMTALSCTPAPLRSPGNRTGLVALSAKTDSAFSRCAQAAIPIDTVTPASEPFGVVDARKQNQDRKSTRLNSSHTVISYAVFCLKKKKKK